MPLVWLLSRFVTSPLPTNWAFLVRIPGWVGLHVFQNPVGPCNRFFCETRSFSRCCYCHRFLQPEVLRLSFPVLELYLTPQLFLLVFLHANVRLLSLPVATLLYILCPSCPSPPLLPVWMNVSSFNSLVVGLSYSSIFWQFWLFFVFKFVVFLLVVRGGKVYLPMPPYWPKSTFFMHIRSLDAQNECLMKNIICCHLKGLGVSKVQ